MHAEVTGLRWLCRYVGYALTTQWEGQEASKLQMIGFDMGGTSTDVSRFAGSYEHVFESTTAGLLCHIFCSLASHALRQPAHLKVKRRRSTDAQQLCRCDHPSSSA